MVVVEFFKRGIRSFTSARTGNGPPTRSVRGDRVWGACTPAPASRRDRRFPHPVGVVSSEHSSERVRVRDFTASSSDEATPCVQGAGVGISAGDPPSSRVNKQLPPRGRPRGRTGHQVFYQCGFNEVTPSPNLCRRDVRQTS